MIQVYQMVLPNGQQSSSHILLTTTHHKDQSQTVFLQVNKIKQTYAIQHNHMMKIKISYMFLTLWWVYTYWSFSVMVLNGHTARKSLLRTVSFWHLLGIDYTKCSVCFFPSFSWPSDQKWHMWQDFIVRGKKFTLTVLGHLNTTRQRTMACDAQQQQQQQQ
jgi:hypothetical protein